MIVFYKKVLSGSIVFILICLLFIRPALADESGFLFTCSSPEGATVYPGDTISCKISLTEAGQSLDWGWLRVHLGEGLLLLEESVNLSCGNEIPIELTASANGSADDPAATPVPIQHNLVSGNDGFVLLSSAMLMGDTIRFQVKAAETGAEASFTVSTPGHEDGFTYSLIKGALPVETPHAEDTEILIIQPVEEAPKPVFLPWLMLPLCLLGICGYGAWRFLFKPKRSK